MPKWRGMNDLSSAPRPERQRKPDWISMLDEARGPIAAELGTEGREAERAMEHAAVKISLGNLRTFPCVRELEARGKLRLRGAFFAISEGVLHLLDEATGQFSPVT
jgi:carbonic anhydrase